MAQYLERINKLASVAGCSVDPFDRAPLIALESEISNLTAGNDSKRQALNKLADDLNKVKFELSSLTANEINLDTEILKELQNFHKKVEILGHYTDAIENREDFLLNKVIVEIGQHNQTIYEQLKEVHERGSEIRKEVEVMRALQRECDELKQKAGGQ